MNIVMLIISSVVFIISLRLTYEIWFTPNEYEAKLSRRRKSIKFLNRSPFFKRDGINRMLTKPGSIFILILSLLGIIFSITGPIQGGR